MKKAFLVFGVLSFMVFFLFLGESYASVEDPCSMAQSYQAEVFRIYVEYSKFPGEMPPVFLHHSIKRYSKLVNFCSQQAFLRSMQIRASFVHHMVASWSPEKKTAFEHDIAVTTEMLGLLINKLHGSSVMEWPYEETMAIMKYVLDRSDSLANLEVEIEAGF